MILWTILKFGDTLINLYVNIRKQNISTILYSFVFDLIVMNLNVNIKFKYITTEDTKYIYYFHSP